MENERQIKKAAENLEVKIRRNKLEIDRKDKISLKSKGKETI